MSRVVKIYHTKTIEEYDYLMGELEAIDYIWWNSGKPTQTTKEWTKNKSKTCVFLYEDKTMSVNSLNYALDTVVSIYPVTLPTQPTTDNVEKPRHYQSIFGLMVETVLRNFIPRYKNTYITYRIASAIKYLLRAPLKNGVEDIKKAYHCIGIALEELGEDEGL